MGLFQNHMSLFRNCMLYRKGRSDWVASMSESYFKTTQLIIGSIAKKNLKKAKLSASPSDMAF